MIPDLANMAGPMIHKAAFTLSAKSLNRLVIAEVAVSYYANTARILDAAIMMYDSRLKNFKVHIDAIKEKETNDTLEFPKLTRNLPIEDYIEGLDVYLGSRIG